jgi:hypothetical protein
MCLGIAGIGHDGLSSKTNAVLRVWRHVQSLGAGIETEQAGLNSHVPEWLDISGSKVAPAADR